MGADISSRLDTKEFVCSLLTPLKKGDKLAARNLGNLAWSYETCLLPNHQVAYPILAIATSSDGGQLSRSAAIKAWRLENDLAGRLPWER